MMPKFYLFPLLVISLLADVRMLSAQCAASAVPEPVTCFGAGDGAIDLTVTDGTAPYLWAWSHNGTPGVPFLDASNNFRLNNLAPGTYIFTVTDDTGCSAITSTIVTQPTALLLTRTVNNPSCNGVPSGAINLSVTGGTPGYSYFWSNGNTTQNLFNLSAGTYTVTVSDINGCTATTSTTITQPAALGLNRTVTQIACFGSNSGAIDLTVTGGTPSYNYNWGGGITTQDRTGLGVGVYTVTVTDAAGCTRTTSATITQPAAIALSTAPVVTSVLCNGGNNGAIDLTLTGGTPAYTYLWNDAYTTQDRTNLTAGNYTVTVTDTKGCSALFNINVGQPAVVVITPIVTDVACGGNTGAIDVFVNGYSYLWSTGSTASSLSNLPVGTYTVTLTDVKSCTNTYTTILGMHLNITSTPAPDCFPTATRSLDLTVTNGSDPYTYLWSNNTSTEDQSGIPAGIYTVTVTEALGCTATASAAVTQPFALEAAAFVINQPCAGESSGKIKLDIMSGQGAPYSMTWSNGSSTGSKSNIPGEPFTLGGLGAGNYDITITNVDGCTATVSATLTSAAPIVLSTSVSNVCLGDNNGFIDLTATGGSSISSYQWSTGSTTQDLNNLPAGTYTVTVNDNNGCSATTSATLGTLPPPEATAVVTPVTCFGGQNGSISLTVTGGMPSVYTYNWSHSVTVQNPTGLIPGTYTVTITDASGCTTTASADVPQPAAQSLTVASIVPTTTCTASDGSLTLSAPAGSQPPYSYNWAKDADLMSGLGLTLGSLASGTYTITLTDGQGCTSTTTAVQTSPMTATATTTATSICTAQDGSIQVSVSGQSSTDLSYNWRRGTLTGSGTTASTDFDINNLPQGNYTVEVLDDAGCFASAQAVVGQGTTNLTAITTSNPTTCGNNNGVITASVTGGMPVFGYLWSTGNTFPTVSNLPPGTYTVTVTEGGSGCTATASATVGTSGTGITAMTATPIAASCAGFTGGITVNATGVLAPFSYAWSGASVGNGGGSSMPFTISNLVPGTYTVTIFDSNSCGATATATVGTAGPVLEATATATAPNGCATADGSIQVNMLGGTQPFAYSWIGGNQTGNDSGITDNTFTISGLKPGWHSITLTDAVGCMEFVGIEVKNPTNFQVSTVAVAPTGCALGNGIIQVEATGGMAPYSYQWWRGNQQGQGGNISTDAFTIPNLIAGEYYLTVKSGDCAVVEPLVVVPAPIMVMASFTVTPASCGGNNGNVDLSVTGGAPPYTYNWSHITGTNDPQDLTNVSPNVYLVTITESTGCSATATVQVGGSLKLNLFSSATQTSTCAAADGTIQLTVTGGAAPFTYDWQHLAGNNNPKNLTGLPPGVYIVTVTDILGCTAVRTTTVLSGALQVTTSVTNSSCSGLPTGIITVDFISPASAVPPYSYNWTAPGGLSGSGSNIAAEPFQITGLINGFYTVTVTNGDGCTRVLTSTLSQGTNITLQTTVTPATCAGGNNGSITLTVTGGIPPYTFSWRNSLTGGLVSTAQNPTNLSAGTYGITVTDASGCTRAGTPVTVGAPTAIMIQSTAQPVTCFGSSDGSIVLTATGGTPPYSVQWSGPNGFTSTVFSIGNLTGGLYTPTITDSKGCTQIGQPVNVQSPNTNILIVTPVISYINCNVVTIDATISLPNYTFTYLWNTGDTNPLLTVPASGTYTVTVTNVTCGVTGERTIEVKPCGQIAGSVLSDEDKNCLDDNEPGLGSWIVKAEGVQTYFGTSQPDGSYNIQVDPGHLYTVSAVPPNTSWIPCLPSNTVLVAQPFDSLPGGDFLFKKKTECPLLTVDLASGNLRRCFTNNFYNLWYCNEGTAPATDAYIIVTLDAFLTPVSSSKPYTLLGNNRIRFNVGNIAVGQCGYINLYVKLDCNAQVGTTHCSEAHIYPDTLCEPPSLQWSGASLRVRSECQADSVQFVLKNVGTADMTKSLEYIVIEDFVMMMKANVILPEGDSTIVKVPARGTTWRLEVEQEPFHPGLSRPASVVEGCNASTTFSTGLVNVFPPDDADKFIDIDCRVNTAAYDPNDKQAVPTGYGAAHYVAPNTPLEYTIRFQNTGNDTAFTVVLRDTLSAWLDPATVRPSASSHPYTWNLSGTGYLTFTFDNILLPDTATNLDASHGFIKYAIWPKDSVPLESVVLNRAGIYFDFNPPIITNETMHTLGKNFLVSSTWQPARAQYRVQVTPNPMGDEARLEVLGLPDRLGDFRLQVFDLQGNVVRDLSATTPFFVLKKENLPVGMYFFRVLEEGKLVGSGKLIRAD